MSKSDTMFIAFRHGGTLPSSIAGGEEKRVDPHDPVRVPRTYGESLVADRFAYETSPKKKEVALARVPGSAPVLTDLDARLADTLRALEDASDLADKSRLETEAATIKAEIEKLKS